MNKNIYVLSNGNKKYKDIEYLNIFNTNYISNKFDFSTYDALIFTSKNAVLSLCHHQTNFKNIESYAISYKTAKIMQDNDINLVYTSSSNNANDFAHEIKNKIKNKKVLYVRAQKVLSDIVNILSANNIICDEFIAYETICNDYTKSRCPSKNSIIIFSSPSCVKCFIKNFELLDTYIIIAIGQTTANALPLHLKYYISNETSIDSCIELAKTFNEI